MATSVVALDVNETLFSLDAVADAFVEVGLDRDDLPLWFARILRDGFAEAASASTVPFPELARHHLRVLGDAARITVDDHDASQVIAAFDEVQAHPDVAQGLRQLADSDLRIVAFTNGSASVAAGFLDRTGLAGVVSEALDVTEAGRWKPHPEAYAWLCRHLRVAPDEVAMVAVHPWDVAGAMRAGLRGVWVDRDHGSWPAWLDAPDLRAESFGVLATALA